MIDVLVVAALWIIAMASVVMAWQLKRLNGQI